MKYLVIGLGLGALTIGGMLWGLPQKAKAAGLLAYQDRVVVARGAEIYGEVCASCHGDRLQGQENWRKRDPEGYLPAPPHDATGHTWHHSDAQLLEIIRFGTAALVGNGYLSRMAGYHDVLTDAEILAVLAYIKSTWPAKIIQHHNLLNASDKQ